MTDLKKVSELFTVKYGVNLELNKLEECKKSDKDSINFVSRTGENNGISAFVKKIEGTVPNKANTISVAVSGSVLASFYQPEPYYSGFHLFVLTPIRKMTPVEMIYYSMCIRSNRYRYNFGRQANKTLKDILIPSKMPKEFSNISMNKIKSEIVSNLHHMVSKFENKSVYGVPRDDSKPNTLKKVSELFTVKYGVNFALSDLEECKKSDKDSINFVSRTGENNGISAFVKKIEGTVPNKANTISVAVSGSVLASFYQPEPYYSGFHLFVLTPIRKMTPVEMIYYSMCIRSNRYRYNFGRQANKTLKDILIPSKMPKEFLDVSLDKIVSGIVSNLCPTVP